MSRTREIELFASTSPDEPLGGAIAVATDGTHDSDGAVRLGVELARRDGVAVALLSVIEPIPFADDEGSTAADAERLTAEEPIGVRHVLVNGTAIRQDGRSLLDVLEHRPGMRPELA